MAKARGENDLYTNLFLFIQINKFILIIIMENLIDIYGEHVDFIHRYLEFNYNKYLTFNLKRQFLNLIMWSYKFSFTVRYIGL